MTTQDFQEIIDFAIAREEESIKFYQDLQKETKFQDQLDMLKEMEVMEKDHKTALENIHYSNITELNIDKVPNLHISEYLTDNVEELDLNYPNLLIMAMKREENSLRLYTELSDRFADEQIANIFRKLASEEAKHKLWFETLYDEWIKQGN
ncbi:MAG: ferritin family protein [Candidatus Cloacimonetes bacterium]|jgi:rubrerythrin|nr:ferritin family protein [Candidatus Cloacimonadota bacterium]MDD5624340.1 ferritin family protein [Candidatus Cloacimonadota bacterium]